MDRGKCPTGLKHTESTSLRGAPEEARGAALVSVQAGVKYTPGFTGLL